MFKDYSGSLSEITPDGTGGGGVVVRGGEPYEKQGIKPGLAVCKTLPII